MDAAELIGLLVETALAASAATLLVLVLRRPLRDAFGAAVAYALWLLVPAAIVAVLLPAPEVQALAMVFATPEVAMHTATSLPLDASFDYAAWMAALWLSGAAVMAGRFGRQQRAFRRRIGVLRRISDGVSQAGTVAGLPAAIGLWQPLIVVPSDFGTRYTPGQRRLMRAHERMHIRCGDLQLNAFAAVLRCVFWFNPLLHLAARHFRHDQELACDQRVIKRHPHARRDYGEAMLKTQLAAQPLPLGCHWAAFDKARNHPLKERIAMLKQPVPSSSRWWAGSIVVGILLVTSGVAAWAAQPHTVVAGTATAIAPPPPPAPPEAPPVPAPPAPPAPPEAPSMSSAPPAPPAPRAPASHPAAAMPATAAVAPAPPVPAVPAPPHPPRAAPVAPPAPPTPATNRTPAPAYPAEALANRISGKVVLVIDVDAQGTPVDVQVERAEPTGVFDQATVDAAMKWRFDPAVENGQPVATRIRVPVEFKAPVTAKVPAASPSR